MKLHEALARAFVAEGVGTLFTLMGDANMHWSISMSEAGVDLIHARHESAALAMAEGYAQASHDVGVASVTSGPGTTQIATALTSAVRSRMPMVVFAGDTPQAASYHLQQFDTAPFVASTGAHLVRIHDVDNAPDAVQRAFVVARAERRPVVLAVPYDLQDADYEWDWFYEPSTQLAVRPQRPHPDPQRVSEAADLITSCERIVVLAGRGAVVSGSGEALVELAQRCGAILATSLKGKGLFEGLPFDSGIAGSFASTVARTYFADADLVVSVGAGFGHFTTEGGYLFPSAKVLQIDVAPRALHEGVPTGELHVAGDATVTVCQITEELARRGFAATGWRTDETRDALADAAPSEPAVQLAPGTVDPRDAMRAIDAAIPNDWLVVIGAGHMWNFATEYLTGRAPERYIQTIDFGAVGQAIGVAIGAAVARPDTGIALIEGDGGLLMHIQELETMTRHGVPVTVFAINDGAYGAEVHKLVARGVDSSQATFGAPDLAAVARAFGVGASRIDATTGDLAGAFADHLRADESHLFDVRISPNVPSAQFRRLHFGEAP